MVVVVVVVYFLWFYFHRDGITNTNYPTTTPYLMGWLGHAHMASLKSFKAKVWGESSGGDHFNAVIQSQQG
jgi:hypothetical protein